MRSIGDKVWTARLKHMEFNVTCPDCLGTKAMTALLENGEKHSLQCGTCYPGGYEGSRGYITKTQYQPAAREQEIIGIQVDREKTEYRFHDWSCYVVYDTEAEAVAACEKIRKEEEDEDHERFVRKKQDAKRTWWWECGYHRRQIADAKKQIAYAEAKLNVAKQFAKQPESVAGRISP
jgi:hypothetical protein